MLVLYLSSPEIKQPAPHVFFDKAGKETTMGLDLIEVLQTYKCSRNT
jgi:hypothetical protein